MSLYTTGVSSSDGSEPIAPEATVGQAIVAVEIAQAVRHEALGYLDNCMADLLMLSEAERSSAAKKHLRSLEDDLLKLGQTLDKLRFLTAVVPNERRLVPLRTLWKEAESLLRGRLNRARVQAFEYRGSDVQVEVRLLWFLQVLVHLVLRRSGS